MITKASIRRFLWHHFPSLHALIYNDVFNEEEYQQLVDYIKKHKEQ